jgi:hypothetical protein
LQFCDRSGLCNRLRGWTGIGAIADYYRLSFIIHWNRNHICDCSFADVFVPNTCAVMPSHRDRGKYTYVRKFEAQKATRVTKWYNETELQIPHDEFWAIATARAQSLRLRPEHEDKLEAFLETVPEDAIGLHVRRTDLREATNSNKPLRKELDRIVEKDPNVTFLLCADNPNSVMWLRRLYGDRIFWREQEMVSPKYLRSRHTSQADAAIDLFSLARTRELIGTYWSSFSSYAALMGGIPLKTF